MPISRESLLDAAKTFCDAFATQKPLDDILSNFSVDDKVVVLEHGLPQLAPFLGREFMGQDGVREYFNIISSLLAYEEMHFENYVVDVDTYQVSVRGKSRFTWSRTGNSWREVFTYVLAFDDKLKVTKYEIWADSGAAYLASEGKLE